jgi:oxygen-independent coproporphyrinogen-3 oxidase
MIGNKEEISLYFHIPFCTRKCSYCHFYVLPDKESSKIELLDGLYQEWERWLPFLQNKTVRTIYFGGGTPFLFGPERVASVLNLIKQTATLTAAPPEITLEANPENVTLELMQAYKAAGINRISLGVQTLDDSLLQLLGRLHCGNKALEAIYTTQAAGIDNISIDLMYDLPQQTLQHWEQTLKVVSTLPITHLSLYNLTIEPHTVFFKKQAILRKLLPDEETSLAMYEMAIDILEAKGLMQYEISAFAKADYQSKHNVGYWTARPFLGLGPSAFSYWENKRFRNIAHLKKYREQLQAGLSPIDFEEELDPQAHVRELLVIELRLRTGINIKAFQEKNGAIKAEMWQVLRQLQKETFLEIDTETIKLTKRGILFYDTVASELI